MKHFTLLCCVLLCCIGCDAKPADSVTVAGSNSSGPDVYMMTVTHDGHKFVTASSAHNGGGISIIHHPACDCLKKQ